MENLTNEIKEHRQMKEKTLHGYTKAWERLSKNVEDKPLTTIAFMKDYKKVMKWVKTKSLSTQKAYLASILVAISPKGKGQYTDGYADVGKKYSEYLTNQSTIYEKAVMEQKKSAQQQKKWVTIEELNKVRRHYKYLIKKLGYNTKNTKLREGKEARHRELIQKYIVASLYLLHPEDTGPRRNIYAGIKVLNVGDYNDLEEKDIAENNYLVVVSRNNKFFSFGDFKTRKTMKVYTIRVTGELNQVLNLWLKINTTGHLLLNARGKPMKSNTLTKFLQKTFEPTGKKVSSQMIRTIWDTEYFDKESSYAKKKKLADSMGHSVATQQKNYIKKE